VHAPTEEDYDELLDFERSERFDERQKTALLYTSHLVWNPGGVEGGLMARMRAQFTEEQVVELGYFVSLTFGQQRWIKTLGIGHGEVIVPSVNDPNAAIAGLAADRTTE
jgi:alkylhydroperoxidase family enzyme